MTSKFIPYGKQWIDDDDINAVVEVLKSDYLTTGPKIKEFEEKFADYVDAEYAVAVSNGTAALHAACFAAGIGEGDQVITTPLTFAASANCILYQGGTPVFADIKADTYNIDPKEIRKKVTDKTKAIIPVHFTGQPCDLDEIHQIAEEYDLIVIEDSAHSLGATYKGRKMGGLSDMSIFSFHPVKHITTGEGGMITTNSKELYNKLIQFRTHGITKSEDNYINESHGKWYHEQQFLGYNYRMTDIQAALGISQLRKSDQFLKRRQEIADIYKQELKDIKWLKLPYQKEDINSSWHLYIIQIDEDKLDKSRKEVFNYFKDNKLGVQVHYMPVYYHPYYKELEYQKGICLEAEELYEKIISIPIYPKMSDDEVRYVIETIKIL
ncbi:UDP-4-keto-6-deoxy-N-acetylglucosamine 4-aminotransferase [Halobacteroides halobius DSM 5150]|uniref:UDP-4-keto-6-deoxy-N-acetylglucosamine 4-aminotransferase n=1 Tax=Halobacteroides halobius (strain ATCC 35273 / DSM 5150 / MD-1) TaxID=748449 RepID=L0KAU4_HALHC|nr:UDP-4-amino-4,6-dideoxy-N-acetyl-beta-L-altrosamine transaminase [Halobacteroides halobius]AGB42136.1 UDP-4-keto-6-deoxy-N-acetylglucosamine 4-aminotransferase [Halobacteroides halobius DSM 5150]